MKPLRPAKMLPGKPSGPQVVDIYARISQDDSGEEIGVDNQIRACREYAAERGWIVRHVFVDNDLSATTGKLRPDFEKLLKANPPAILCFHTDRLIRLTKDLERVIDLAVNVFGITAGHFDLSTPAGRAVARTVTAWATYEGEQKAERQKLANLARAKAGDHWWPWVPFGFNEDKLTLKKPEADALVRAYEELITGVPLTSLAATLNASGFQTNRGKPWTSTSLRPVLLNPRNAGIRAYWGEEVGPAKWKPIVKEELFRAAVRHLSDPSRKTSDSLGAKASHLNTGLATCGVCCGRVKIQGRNGKRDDAGFYRVYLCRLGYCVSHRADWLDAYVTERTIQLLASGVAAAVFAQGEGNVEEIRATVVDLRSRLDAFAEDYAMGLVTRSQMITGTGRVRQQLAENELALASTLDGSPIDGLDGSEDEVRARWNDPLMTMDHKRAVVGLIFPRISLLPRGRGVRDMRPEYVDMPDPVRTAA